MDTFGSIDFVQYWSAYQLLVSGSDPYDPALTLAVQCSTGLHCQYPRTTYTPPWVWLLMSPALMLPLQAAAWVWAQASVLLTLLSGVVLAWGFRLRTEGALLSAAAMLVSFPFVINWLFGQLSPLLALGAVLLFLGRMHGRSPLDALGLFLLSAKPHLFLGLGAAVAVYDIHRRRARSFILLALLLIPFIAVAELLSPGVVLDWLRHLVLPRTDVGVRPAASWATDAPAAALARALASNGTPPGWPLLAIPAAGLIVSAIVGWRVRRTADWLTVYPVILWVSMVTAPFVWFSDFAVLNLLQAAAIAVSLANGHRQRAFIAFAAGVAYHVGIQRLESAGVPHFGLDEMFWFPIGLLAIWFATLQLGRVRL